VIALLGLYGTSKQGGAYMDHEIFVHDTTVILYLFCLIGMVQACELLSSWVCMEQVRKRVFSCLP